MKKVIFYAAAVLCMPTLLVGCGGSSGTYHAGTYTATAEGYGGDIKVEIGFDRDSILSVKITEQSETVGISERAVEELPDKILEMQTYEVDAVSSATVTSNAIKDAVKDCMEQAKVK